MKVRFWGTRGSLPTPMDPALDDDTPVAMLEETRRFEAITRGDHQVQISSAYDGLELSC